MRIIEIENKLCSCCMERHEVKKVLVDEHTHFKDTLVNYRAIYSYCDRAEELYMEEDAIQENDIVMKDAYRKSQGLLTTKDIIDIRSKYDISQKELCILLGWGEKTITRYEGHQVQDKAHDTILKKLNSDPQWFITLLENTENRIPKERYQKYLTKAKELYEKSKDSYLTKAIEAKYAQFQGDDMTQGNVKLCLDKVIDVIRYFSYSDKVTNLYKVKLMKLLWYADALSYRDRGKAITGLVYQALPMGAVPIAHEMIIELNNVPCEEIVNGETIAYHFSLTEENEFKAVEDDEKHILDKVIDKLGYMTTNEIVSFMHRENAYVNTKSREIIQYKYAKDIQM